jgi:hypothetical protein
VNPNSSPGIRFRRERINDTLSKTKAKTPTYFPLPLQNHPLLTLLSLVSGHPLNDTRSHLDSLLPAPLPAPEPILRRSETRPSSILLETLPINLLPTGSSSVHSRELVQLTERFVKVLPPYEIAFATFLLQAWRFQFANGDADDPPHAEEDVLAEDDGEEECPAFDIFWCASRSEAVVGEEIDKGRSCDGTQPGEETKTVEPRANGIGAPWRRALHLDADFDRVGAEFEPVVYDEGYSCEGPDDREEGEVTELDEHIS